MDAKMTRRHWFGALVAGLVGFCTTRRAPVRPAPVAPPAARRCNRPFRE